jgi:AcrR family transcriptional regulator
MTASITKKRLIEVARQLFAKNGVESTTMNDIAEASQRGRRTLYTYFGSKADIYKAVIESEFDVLYKKMDDVLKRNVPADEKLIMLVFTRIDAIKEVVFRNGTLRAGFFRDIWRVENVRKEFDRKEIQYLEAILKAGIEQGVFVVNDIRHTAKIVHYALKGLEVPAIRGVIRLDYSKKEDRSVISDLIFRGLYKRG